MDVASRTSYRPKVQRVKSAELADLHVYIVPPDLWRERYNNLLNQNVTETISAGIIRVHPDTRVCNLRDELEAQLGAELLPRDYIFLKSVGRSITRLKPKQEFQLKVKHFLPPNSYAPELYLLEVENRDDENDTTGSTRPTTRSPQFTESEDERQSNRFRQKPRNATSPYRYTSPLPKIKSDKGGTQKPHETVPHFDQNGDLNGETKIPVNNSWGGGVPDTKGSPRHSPTNARRTPPARSPPPHNDYPPPPSDYPDTSHLHSPPNSGDRDKPVTNSHQPVASKYDPRAATYTNHTNDSGIAGLTPEEYRESFDDAERRKNEYNTNRQKELHNRLNGEEGDADHQRRQREDREGEEWERKRREEDERRRREEEERRRREEEERQREEDERRRREEEREKMAREKLSGSDEGVKTKQLVPDDPDWTRHGFHRQADDDQRSVMKSHPTVDQKSINRSGQQTNIHDGGMIGRKSDPPAKEASKYGQVTHRSDDRQEGTAPRIIDTDNDRVTYNNAGGTNVPSLKFESYDEKHSTDVKQKGLDSTKGSYRQDEQKFHQEYDSQGVSYQQESDNVDENNVSTNGKISKTFVKENIDRRQQQSARYENEEEVYNVPDTSRDIPNNQFSRPNGKRYPSKESDDSNLPGSPDSDGKIDPGLEDAWTVKGKNSHQSSFPSQNRVSRIDDPTRSGKPVLHYHKTQNPQKQSDLNRFPSPPPMHVPSSIQGQDTSNLTKEQKQAEKKRLLQELEAAREARRAIERQREELVKKAKLMQNKTQNRRNHARDLWKKRYFEEKKRTPPLEEQCNKLRHELDVIHRKLMNALEGSSKDKNTRIENLKPSKQNNYKIQATRLTHEIDDLRRRLENAKMKLTAEMKLRNQAETELRALRAELTQKKIHLTLARNQHIGVTPAGTAPSSVTGDNTYYRTPALSNKA